MVKRYLILPIIFVLSVTANATNLEITTFGKEKVFYLKNAAVVCDGKNLGESLLVAQGGAESQIPLSAIMLFRTLRQPIGFYMKTKTGKELTGNHMAYSNYKWVGENEFGGVTSIDGHNWRIVKVGG